MPSFKTFLTSLLLCTCVAGSFGVFQVYALESHDEMDGHEMGMDCEGGDCEAMDLDCLEHCIDQLDVAEAHELVFQNQIQISVVPQDDLNFSFASRELKRVDSLEDIFLEPQILTTQKRE